MFILFLNSNLEITDLYSDLRGWICCVVLSKIDKKSGGPEDQLAPIINRWPSAICQKQKRRFPPTIRSLWDWLKMERLLDWMKKSTIFVPSFRVCFELAVYLMILPFLDNFVDKDTIIS